MICQSIPADASYVRRGGIVPRRGWRGIDLDQSPLARLRCDVAENLDQFGDLAPLVLCIAGGDGVLDASSDVIAQNFVLDLLQGGFDRLDLVQDIDAIAFVRDHTRDAAHLPLDAIEAGRGGLLDSIPHTASYIPVEGISPAEIP